MSKENEDIEYRRRIVSDYRPDVDRLVKYVPWLEEKAGRNVSENFTDSGIGEHSIPFPVYNSTLLGFIKEVQKTKLLDRNYVYVYSKNKIKSTEDELKAISQADIMHMDILKGILSKYVMGGMTKGRMWTDAVQNRIFLNIVRKMKENLDFWG